MIAGIGGLVLLISLFLKWYGFDLGNVGGFNTGISASVSGWESFSMGDLFLALVALIAIAPAAFDIAGLEIELPIPMSTVSLAGGGLALLYVIYRILDKPGPDVSFGGTVDFGISLKFGIFVALAGAIVICVGSYLQLGEEEAGAAPGFGVPGVAPPVAPPQAPPAAPPPPPQAPPQAPPPPPQVPPQAPPPPPQAPPPAG